MSLREQILDAAVGALDPVMPGHVYRVRQDHLPDLPAIIVRASSEEDAGEMLGVIDRKLTVAVDIFAQGETAGSTVDDLLEDVLDRLRVADALGLGSDVDVQPRRRVEWDYDGLGEVRVTVEVEIDYRIDT